jgi:hypothetical protein
LALKYKLKTEKTWHPKGLYLHHGEGGIKFKQEQIILLVDIAANIIPVKDAYHKNFVLAMAVV